jgi:hypothetical protein
MSAVLSDPLSPSLLAGVTMSPRPKRPMSDVISSVTLKAWAAQPVASDEEAEAPTPPQLLLTQAEVEGIQCHAQAFRDARTALTTAEATLATAERAAGLLESFKRRAAEASADAFIGNATDKAVRESLRSQIAESEEAASALPVLRQRSAESSSELNRRYGALRVAVRTALEHARGRQAAAYALHAEALRVAVGHMSATIALLDTHTAAWFTHFVPELSVPAPPVGVRVTHKGVETLQYREMLVKHGHSALAAMETASKHWLQRQIQDAAGLPVSKLL